MVNHAARDELVLLAARHAQFEREPLGASLELAPPTDVVPSPSVPPAPLTPVPPEPIGGELVAPAVPLPPPVVAVP